MLGTPRFASPEAAVGRRVDTRADLYAVALVLYLMLAGRGPFDHHSGAASVMAAHILDDPVPPSQYAAEPIPYPLDKAVLRGLRKAPDERFQSANAFQAELERTIALLRQPLGWVETTVFPPAPPALDAAPQERSGGAVLEDTSRDGTTFQLPTAVMADRSLKALTPTFRPAAGRLPSFVVPFVLGMALAGAIAAGVALLVGR